MTHRKNQRKTNGQAVLHDPANGHAPASAERDDIPACRDRAAPDDADGFLVAGATSSVAAGANLDACADAAQAEGHGMGSRKTGTPPRPQGADGPDRKKPDTGNTSSFPEIPPGTKPLPIDGPAFVDAVHKRVDLVQLEVRLLKSGDLKLVQRELAYLLDLKYGKGAGPAAEGEFSQMIRELAQPNLGSTKSE